MGNGMNKVLPGLYLGNFRDARDQNQLKENGITHILAIHDNAKPALPDRVYLCISASDTSNQELRQYFSQTNDFIHRARLNGGSVLVHCLAGVSRSVTITTAYIMTVTGLGWRDALNAVRGARRCANPNFGFQRQLLAFQHEGLDKEKQRLIEAFGAIPFRERDLEQCTDLISVHSQWVLKGDEAADPDIGLYPLPLNAYGQSTTTAPPEAAAKSAESTAAMANDDSQVLDEMFETSAKNLQESREHSVRESTARDILQSISCTGTMPSRKSIQDMQKKNQLAQDTEIAAERSLVAP